MSNPVADIMVAHCKGRYPREAGFPYRKNRFSKDIIRSGQDLLNTVHQHNTQRGENTYVSVYSFAEIRSDEHNVKAFRELRAKGLSKKEIFTEHKTLFEDIVNRDSAVIDCYYLDFDDETEPIRAIYEARNIVKLLKNYGVSSRIYWSGNKGIALYVDFEPVKIAPCNIKAVVAKFNDYVKNLFQSKPASEPLKTLCDCTKDGQSRISRIPNTKHKTSGLYCTPLLESDLWATNPLEHIRELAKKPRTDIDLTTITRENEKKNTVAMHDLTHRIEVRVIAERASAEKADRFFKNTKTVFHNNGEWHKCAGVTHAEEYGQTHPGREPTADGLILAYKLWGNYPIEKIRELLKTWICEKCKPARDFPLINERIEKFYSMDKSYSPCTFLMKYGHCNGSGCSLMRKKGTQPEQAQPQKQAEQQPPPEPEQVGRTPGTGQESQPQLKPEPQWEAQASKQELHVSIQKYYQDFKQAVKTNNIHVITAECEKYLKQGRKKEAFLEYFCFMNPEYQSRRADVEQAFSQLVAGGELI